MLRCIFGPNLVILAWTADELWGGQAQKEVKFDFQVKFDLEGQDRSSPKTIGTLTKVFCTFMPNLVILAWMSVELSCGQARDWYTHIRTHGHTDTQTQTIPEGQNWPRVKIILKCRTEHGCYTVMLCAKFQKDLLMKMGVMGLRAFVGFHFKMDFVLIIIYILTKSLHLKCSV